MPWISTAAWNLRSLYREIEARAAVALPEVKEVGSAGDVQVVDRGRMADGWEEEILIIGEDQEETRWSQNERVTRAKVNLFWFWFDFFWTHLNNFYSSLVYSGSNLTYFDSNITLPKTLSSCWPLTDFDYNLTDFDSKFTYLDNDKLLYRLYWEAQVPRAGMLDTNNKKWGRDKDDTITYRAKVNTGYGAPGGSGDQRPGSLGGGFGGQPGRELSYV